MNILSRRYPAFNYIAANLQTFVTIDDQHFKLLEQYTVILYNKYSDLEFINETWEELFCLKNKTHFANSRFPAAALEVSYLPWSRGHLTWPTSQRPVQMDVDRQWMETASAVFLFGTHYQKLRKPALNKSSVVAKMQVVVVQGAHARGHTGNVHIFAVVNLINVIIHKCYTLVQ